MDQALLDRVQKQAWFYRFPRGWPFVLFLLASIGTIISVMAIERADRQTRQVELDRNLTEIASALQRRATENVALLRAASALFATQESVTYDQFDAFAQDLQGQGNLYGSLGLGWAPLIPVDRLPFFEVALHDQGQEDFIVSPRPSPGQIYSVPIVYIQPDNPRNRAVIGYDMYSDPVRRAAMNLSMQLGKPVASGMVHLKQDAATTKAAGFLIYMPVVIIQNGRKVVKGFVYSPVRAENFLKSASELYSNHALKIAIYDEKVSPETLLAERMSPGLTGLTMERQIEIGTRKWLVVVSDTKGGMLSPLARITLFFGVLASLMVMAMARLITKRAAEDRQVLEWLSRQAAMRNSLTRELNHRVKNTLANVLSIATLTRRDATNIDTFTESLTARIRALSTTHDVLSQTNWRSAAVGDVIQSELAPYVHGIGDRVAMSGPAIDLAANDAMSLGLAIHELATNAAKYGAFSDEEGRVDVTWRQISPEIAEVDWRESCGPPVSEPVKRGFGRDLIEKIVAHELKEPVELRFNPGGVECRLRVPVRAAREFMLRRIDQLDR